MRTNRIERRELAAALNAEFTIYSHNRKDFYFVKLYDIRPDILTEEARVALIRKAEELGAINIFFKETFVEDATCPLGTRKVLSFIAYFPKKGEDENMKLIRVESTIIAQREKIRALEEELAKLRDMIKAQGIDTASAPPPFNKKGGTQGSY